MEVLLWAAVVLLGWLLGGPVGIGTILGAFGAGVVMQLTYSLIRFEPRDLRQRDILEIARILLGKDAGERRGDT